MSRKLFIGNRLIDPNDPIFKGHFPDYPIYPGVLQLEMIGQLGICYYVFSQLGTVEINKKNDDFGVRALKIYHTLFQGEVLPNDNVTIIAKVLESDDFKFKGMGQIIKGDTVCTVVIAEFYIV